MMKHILLSLFIIASIFSCSTSAKVGTDADSRRLVFGNGGGFTGIYTTYELRDDGNVYALVTDSTIQPVKKLRRKLTRDIFAQADKLKIAQPAFDHPGNMTWFIKFHDNGSLTEYKWGDANAPVPDQLKDLYNQLNTFVK